MRFLQPSEMQIIFFDGINDRSQSYKSNGILKTNKLVLNSLVIDEQLQIR